MFVPPSVTPVCMCVYVCVVHSICTACMCLCVLFVWIRRGTQQRAVKSALEYAWVCVCVPSYRARASWNKCNHSAHTLLLNNAEPCVYMRRTRVPLNSRCMNTETRLKAGMIKLQVVEKDARNSPNKCVWFMVMSCQVVFCRQHLGVYAAPVVSRKTGERGGEIAAWYLHTAATPSGSDDGSLMAPKDRNKPRENQERDGVRNRRGATWWWWLQWKESQHGRCDEMWPFRKKTEGKETNDCSRLSTSFCFSVLQHPTLRHINKPTPGLSYFLRHSIKPGWISTCKTFLLSCCWCCDCAAICSLDRKWRGCG